MAGYHFPRYHPYLQSQILSGGVPEVNSLYLAALAETGVAGLAALLYCGLAGIAGLLRSVAPKSIETRPGAVPWAPDDADLRIDRNGREATIAFWALLASLGGCAVHYLGLNPLFLIYFTGLLSLAVSAARLIETERWSLTYER
jgi:O-antigen ligase